MRTTMIKTTLLNAVVCLIFQGLMPAMCLAQDEPGRPPAHRSEPLTNRQIETVKSILSAYNASSLTTADAKAIHKAFREAGLRGGPELNSAVQNAGVDPEQLRELDPPPGDQGQNRRPQGDRRDERRDDGAGRQRYSLEQAVSDNAQLHTIAFNGLAFLTGDFGASTFIPPGKVCDFFGFQYMRDIDAAEKGHNPMFLNRVAGNVLHVLNDQQKQIFLDLAEQQTKPLEQLAMLRLPLIKAFHIHGEGKIPAGSDGLNKKAVMQHVGKIFAYDAELSLRRAEAMAKVFLSLTSEQKAYLAKMKFGDFNTWPDIDERGKLGRGRRGEPRLFNVAYMTYASEFFSWTAGSLEADTYFCPERHGTYFGGFYMKDMPAMGKRDFDISTSVTGDSGKAFLEKVLTREQRALITALTDQQGDLLKEIIVVRRSISQELRKLLTGETPKEAEIIALGRRYGELDGQMSWCYATAFARVNRTLTRAQRAALERLRNLNDYVSAPYYVYSDPAQDQPVLESTEAFFYNPKGAVR